MRAGSADRSAAQASGSTVHIMFAIFQEPWSFIISKTSMPQCEVLPSVQSFLELCVFLGRPLKAPQVRRVDRVSKSKVAHLIQIRHRDEVEAPLTDWMQEAYDMSAAPASQPASPPARATTKPAARSTRANKTKASKAKKVKSGAPITRRSRA
jgi:hypothetical protein